MMCNVYSNCCINCFTDIAIKNYIESSEDGVCDFCGSQQIPIIKVEEIIEFIDECIGKKYEHSANHIPCEYAEGGYQMPTLLINEILESEETISENEQLLEIISKNSEYDTKDLSVKHPFLGPGDYFETWEKFCDYVKHKSRYSLFFQYRNKYYEFEDVNVKRVEDYDKEKEEIIDLFNKFEIFLLDNIYEIEPGNLIFRARINKTNKIFEHEDLTSPPIDKTINCRMNPIGISYFYGGEDESTCIAEVNPKINEIVVIAEFRTLKKLKVLNLVDFSPSKSIFEEDYNFLVDELLIPFLDEFSIDISKPISKDIDVLEYIPTQIFSEFIKNISGDQQIYGIRYKSAVKIDGISLVLFRDREISLSSDKWIEFVKSYDRKIENIEFITAYPTDRYPE
ncbi:MAG: HEPN-associated N-terminal domain-containing protein [Candidatus Omnitrophota bacterium]